MREKFVVIGLGFMGTGIAKALAKRGAEVIAMDYDVHKVESLKDEVAHAVALDCTDSKALDAQNIQDVDAAVISIGHNFESLILTAVHLKEMGVKRIIARASSTQQKKILEKVGILEVFAPDEEVGKTVAERLIHPDVKAFLPLPDDYEIVEVNVPKRIANKSLDEVNIREKYDLNLITIKRRFSKEVNGEKQYEEHLIGVPKGDTVVMESDVLIILGKSYDVDKFIEINK